MQCQILKNMRKRHILVFTYEKQHQHHKQICTLNTVQITVQVILKSLIIPIGGCFPVTSVNLDKNVFLSVATTPIKWPTSCPSMLVNDHAFWSINQSNLPIVCPNLVSIPNWKRKTEKSYEHLNQSAQRTELVNLNSIPGSWHNALQTEFIPGTPTYLVFTSWSWINLNIRKEYILFYNNFHGIRKSSVHEYSSSRTWHVKHEFPRLKEKCINT